MASSAKRACVRSHDFWAGLRAPRVRNGRVTVELGVLRVRCHRATRGRDHKSRKRGGNAPVA
eukprot:6202273-Pleurochrysis_carterae.AAC.2